MIIILALPSVRRFIRYINIPPIALLAIVATIGAENTPRTWLPAIYPSPTYLSTYLPASSYYSY
jgi:hypothetical protein